ncbi:hypothetical protein C0J52_02324 [Blattella germanica]|nr:hypothetical protein C0J52_02324 [Blattella germanica]
MIPELEFDDEVLVNEVNITNTTGACGLGLSTSWTNTDVAPVIAPFIGDSGVKVDVLEGNNNPFLWMKTFLDDHLLKCISIETNRYANQYLSTHVLYPQSQDYMDVTIDEMCTYLGITFMTGIDKRPGIEYWSTRVELSEILRRGTYVCGTLRLNRGAPKELKDKVKILKKGETAFAKKGQVLTQVWKDKRDVKLISTIHTAQVVESEKTTRNSKKISRPEIIGDYNLNKMSSKRVEFCDHDKITSLIDSVFDCKYDESDIDSDNESIDDNATSAHRVRKISRVQFP